MGVGKGKTQKKTTPRKENPPNKNNPKTGALAVIKMRDGPLDAVRGIAFALMCLNHCGIATTPTAATVAAGHIARTAFLVLVGVTYALFPKGAPRRVWTIAAHALLVSVVSRMLLPTAWVRFGVLHCIASCLAALVVIDRAGMLPFGAEGVWALCSIAIHNLAPRTNTALDYVTRSGYKTIDAFPLVTWFPVVLFGLAVARAAKLARFSKLARSAKARRKGDTGRFSITKWVGRNTLPLYTAQMLVLIYVLSRKP